MHHGCVASEQTARRCEAKLQICASARGQRAIDLLTSTRVREPYYDERANALYFVPAAGGEIVKLVDAAVGIGSYAPSPDGKWIAFSGTPSKPVLSHSQSDLYVVATTPGQSQRSVAASNVKVKKAKKGLTEPSVSNNKSAMATMSPP